MTTSAVQHGALVLENNEFLCLLLSNVALQCMDTDPLMTVTYARPAMLIAIRTELLIPLPYSN